MLILDTHTWIWWIHDPDNLTKLQIETIKRNEDVGLGVCAITCWEIAKLVEFQRLKLSLPLGEWFEQAFRYPGMKLEPLTPQISIESTQLPGDFHRDPADQIIVATARVLQCPLVTSDKKIRKYQHVKTIY